MKKTKFATALLLTLGIVTGCGNASAVQTSVEVPKLLNPVDVPISTTTVGYNDILISTYYEATVVPYVEEYVFPINGSIYDIYFELGDDVQKGDLLAELNHEKLDSQIESLQNRINSKKSAADKENSSYQLQIERLKLKKDNIRSGKVSSSNPAADIALIDCDIALYEKRIEQTTANLEKELVDLEENLELLTENYPDYFLYAPMSGRVIYVSSAKEATLGTTVIAVADLQTKYIQTNISAENYIYSAYDVYALHDGNRYSDLMHVPAIYDTTCVNLVSAKGMFANFILPADSMNSLNFGDFVLICVDTDFVEHALSIPNTSLYKDDSGSYVYLVSEDGVRTRKDIITGITNSIYTVVLDGLEEGDVIYVPN
ncbi:MAG: biotin/lipoyl-binding protein [Lachnospiraceae bacterium]|nr:biotin/lipoyl-binding protein [Lachnospiraceae bacterium]